MQDKIALLMEETGCDRAEAELALSMCGFEVEKAVKEIPRLLKNIAVVKAKFHRPDQHHFGLVLVVLNLKLKTLLRARAVVSLNPAVYAASLDKGWFEFEKNLYGCRLWEGSLQNESQDLEAGLANHYRAAPSSPAFAPGDSSEAVSEELSGVLKGLFSGSPVAVALKREILDLGTFQSLEAQAPKPARRSPSHKAKADEPLVLKVVLEEDPAGIAASELRAGDLVSARIVDARDIAQYLSKILGGYSEAGPQPIAAPVEAVETTPQGTFVRVRFAVGACADASVAAGSRLKAVPGQETERLPWWRRFFKAR